MNEKLNILFNQIKNECLNLISKKKVDLDESIALEARNEGKQIECKEKNIEHVRKLMEYYRQRY